MKKDSKVVRIAHIVGKWVGGGVEAFLMNYYKNIDHSKIQFDFICDDDSINIPYEEIEKLGGKVILIPPYQKVVKYQKELRRVLKDGNYSIVHSHINTLSVFPLMAAKKAGIPIRIAHSHSTTNKTEWKKNLMKQVLRLFAKVYPTHYYACSEHAGRWMFGDKVYDEGKVTLVNNAIDLDNFKYDEKFRAKKRKEFDIKDSTLVVGNIGRFVTVKNHSFLIDIFNEIYKKNNDSILLLAGQGPLVDEMKGKVKGLGLENNVMFLGQIDNVYEVYQAMDLFILPSLYEGLGMVLIEAECAGLPCFASTEVPEIAKVNDNMKFISLEEDANIWADKILDAIKGYERVDCTKDVQNAGYDIKLEVKKLEKKYSELLKVGGGLDE